MPPLKTQPLLFIYLLFCLSVCLSQVPFFFKQAVDLLGGAPDLSHLSHPTLALFTSAGALLVGYGLARGGASLFNEARNAVFAKVAQSSIRRVARRTFLHLHNLDLECVRFSLSLAPLNWLARKFIYFLKSFHTSPSSHTRLY